MTDILNVEIFSSVKSVEGWFTRANRNQFNPNGEIPGLNCGLNTTASNRETERNRKKCFSMIGLDFNQVALAHQVHGNQVKIVNRGGIYPATDAFVTDQPGLALTIQVADCAALLIADPGSEVVAAVHAGWRGAMNGIVERTVQTMERQGASVDQMLAWISPCISQRYFEVGEEVAEQFPPKFVSRDFGPKPHVDLRGAVRHELMGCGVTASRIQTDNGCTFQEEKLYYSWRRDRDTAGRMLALVRIQAEDKSDGNGNQYGKSERIN